MKPCIVTPCLNQRELLADCIEHLQAQDVASIHVVSDGASTDGSAELLLKHSQRPEFFGLSKSDTGMYQGLNRGFELGHGDVLGYLNCDDRYLPWTLELVCSRFAADPQLEIIVGDAVEIRGDRAALIIQPPARMLLRHLSAGFILPQPAIFFRRSLWERLGGFDESLRLLGDHDFFFRALNSGAKVARIWEVLAVQNMLEDQLMQRHARAADEEKKRILMGADFGREVTNRIQRLLPPALHRLGMVSSLLPSANLRANGAKAFPGPWPKFRSEGLIQLASKRQGVMALFGTSRERTVFKLTVKGRELLLPHSYR